MNAAAHTPHRRLSREATCLTEMVSVSMMTFTVSKADRFPPNPRQKRHAN